MSEIKEIIPKLKYGEVERDASLSHGQSTYIRDDISINKNCVCYYDKCICSEWPISQKLKYLHCKIKLEEEGECDFM